MLSINTRSLALSFTFLSVLFVSMQAGASEWQLNMTEGVTSISKEVYGLHMLTFYICCVIGVLVFGAMFISMYLHRKSRGAKASNFHESLTLELAWTIVPALILIAIAFPATTTLKKIYNTDDADIDIKVTGIQWKWKYEYLGENVTLFSNLSDESKAQVNSANKQKSQNYLLDVDNRLIIPAGKKVRFLVTADDVIHSWWVPELAVKRDAIPGYINEAWTKVDKPGVYRGQCAELCGKDHGFMPIVVEVVPEAQYNTWLAAQRKKAEEIAEAAKQTLTFDELYTQGEQVYLAQCAACHQADGKGAGVFPAIAGSAIAMGDVSLHLNRVVNGGAGMPAFGEALTPVDAAAVITYQRNAFGNNMGDQIQPIDVVNYKQSQ